MPYTTLSMAAAAEAAAERERAVATRVADDPLDAAWVQSLDRQRAGKAAKWIPDTAVLGCMLCAKRFNLFRRRHHCRRCGACVCDQCSSARVPASLLPEGQARKPDKSAEQIGDPEQNAIALVAQRSMDALANDTNLTYVRVCAKCAKTIDAQLKEQIKGRHRCVPAPPRMPNNNSGAPTRAAPQAPPPSESSSSGGADTFVEEKEERFDASGAPTAGLDDNTGSSGGGAKTGGAPPTTQPDDTIAI